MSNLQYLTMHADNPQPRLIKQAVEILQSGKLIAYPTDSTYALGCALHSKDAINTLRQLRDLKENHPLTLICSSISEVSHYCAVNNQAFAILKQSTPGPFTFILPANKEVPRPAQGIKRRVVGIRIPDHPIVAALVSALGTPLISSTLWLEGDEYPLCDPQEILQKTRGKVSLILDAGMGHEEPTTVIDLTGNEPELIREGKGDLNGFNFSKAKK